MPINSHNGSELKHNKLNDANIGSNLTISMGNSNEIRPHRDPEGRAGLREGNPHPLFHKFLTFGYNPNV